MKIKSAVLILSLWATAFITQVYAVDVPEFSFKGQEIASFAIAPSFKDIDLSISVPSEYNNYVDKQSIAVANDVSGEYSADEPSFVYGYKPLTAIASVFVGQKAYRNYFVKMFVNKDYKRIVENYPRFKNDISEREFVEEVDFIFASALWEQADPRADEMLKKSCLDHTGDLRLVACDRYSEILWNEKRYEELVELGDSMAKPYSIYTFSAYTMAHLHKGNYDRVTALLNDNAELIFSYADFNDLRAVVEYQRSNYVAVSNLSQYTTDRVAFITADSFINTGRFNEARAMTAKVDDPADAQFLNAKYLLGMKRYTEAEREIAKVDTEQQRLDLLKFYVSNEFPNLDNNYTRRFHLTSAQTRDFPAYYEGLQYFYRNRYRESADAFATVRAPVELVTEAKFYRGIALVYVDPDAAEQDIVNTMNTSTDPEQVAAARFMLAQVYYLKGRGAEAMQLVDGCNEGYCRQLRAEIFIQNGYFDRAMADVEGLDTAQAHLIRASAYYNMREYDKAERELDAIKASNLDSEHLRMKLHFKRGNVSAAKAILNENKDHKPIVYDGVKELMLIGDYNLALTLLNASGELPPDMMVVKAKILAWSGKPTEARRIYTDLLSDNEMVYDSLFGLVSLESGKNESQVMEEVVKRASAMDDFPQKDLLLAQIAGKASRDNDNVILVRVVNMFFPKYEDSPYAGDMYAERAKLFYDTGRSADCLNDIFAATAKNPMLTEDLRFMKAQCYEDVNLELALDEYKTIFMQDDQFSLPAAVRYMDLTDDPASVLEIAELIKDDNPQLYIEGVRRYVEVSPVAALEANEGYINKLAAERTPALRAAGLYAKARILNESGSGREAAATYAEIYKVSPSDHFAPIGLDAAIIIYKELKMDKEAADAQVLRSRVK